jgi:hypothetical protein
MNVLALALGDDGGVEGRRWRHNGSDRYSDDLGDVQADKGIVEEDWQRRRGRFMVGPPSGTTLVQPIRASLCKTL